jgi:hypothetical protein
MGDQPVGGTDSEVVGLAHHLHYVGPRSLSAFGPGLPTCGAASSRQLSGVHRRPSNQRSVTAARGPCGPSKAVVGEDEADPKVGTVSFVSPVARVLMGKAVGDLVEASGQTIEIIEIS